MRQGRVRVSISTGSAPSADDNDANVTLRIEEVVSGVTLAEVDFSPAEWWRLIIGSSRVKDADVVDGKHVALIGLQMVNTSVMVPKEVYDHIPPTYQPGVYDRARPEQLDAGEQWARDLWADIPEPKAIGTRWSNSGMTAYIRYWAEPVPCPECGRYQGDHDYLDRCRTS